MPVVAFPIHGHLTLREAGSSIRVYEPQGQMVFSTTEVVVRDVAEGAEAILFTNLGGVPVLRRAMKMAWREQYETLFQAFDATDLALEWCENQVLERNKPLRSFDTPMPAADYQLFQGLTSEEVTVIGELLQRRISPKGAVIVNIGDPANELFIVARGSVSVNITLASGSQRRSGTVLADSEVECDMLKVDDFNRCDAAL